MVFRIRVKKDVLNSLFKERSSGLTLDCGALNQPGEAHPSVHDTVTERERSRENRLHNRRLLLRRSQTQLNSTSSKETIQLLHSLHSISGEMKSVSNIISHPDRCCYSSAKHLHSGIQVVVAVVAVNCTNSQSAMKEGSQDHYDASQNPTLLFLD